MIARRKLIMSIGAASSVALAGCSDGSGPNDANAESSDTPDSNSTESTPNPSDESSNDDTMEDDSTSESENSGEDDTSEEPVQEIEQGLNNRTPSAVEVTDHSVDFSGEQITASVSVSNISNSSKLVYVDLYLYNAQNEELTQETQDTSVSAGSDETFSLSSTVANAEKYYLEVNGYDA